MFKREQTRQVAVGGVKIGGGAPVTVQSMTNTDTRDAKATVEQIKRLQEAGCEIVRVAVPDMEAARAIASIRPQISIPLVADIHFDYRLALESIDSGADKIRINPGNIGSYEKTAAVTEKCARFGIPIRIGVNGGSLEKKLLEKYGGATAEALAESAEGHVRILESLGFYDTVVSMKASDVMTTLGAYRIFAEKFDYPLHVGITEAGTVWGGTVKSCVGLGAVLACGIGDTVRVSLTGDPLEEVRVARKALQSLGLGGNRHYEFTSCPTCGRTCVDLIGTAEKIENGLDALESQGLFERPFRAAVMGCAVNGPGEAREADIGLAGGDGCFLIFEKGEITGKIPEEDAAARFLEIVKKRFAKKIDGGKENE
ncbi:MAG: flavodoxin-dependent (E)-4-hydroxy-3-methylbut-2-enyl-diphosphate synthase [Clostridia bacterium]|nr:flavodoxin-dependent (E)-4-hydroxy-3-methylbut-2-enyl-diphosphate synthase [Clostridia bacterium]